MLLNILISFLLVSILFFIKEKLVLTLNIFDHPDSRKVHKKPIPLIGGTLIYLYIIVFCIFTWSLVGKNFLFEFSIFSINNFIFLNVVIFFIYFVGLIDDKFKITNFKKLLLLSIFVLSLCYQDKSLIPDMINLSFGINFSIQNLDEIFIFLIIISFITAMNLFDGINLQAGIFYLINFIFLGYYLGSINILFIFVVPLIFFLVLNYRNICFLGDSGSNLLSFILIYIYLKAYFHSGKIPNLDSIFLFIFLPCIDALRLLIYRLWVYGNPFRADMNHFHHILLKKFNYKITICISSIFILMPHLFFIFNLNFFISAILLTSLYMVIFFKTKKII